MHRYLPSSALCLGLLFSVTAAHAKAPTPTQCDSAERVAKAGSTPANLAVCVEQCAQAKGREAALRWCTDEQSRLELVAEFRAREAEAEAKLNAEKADARRWHTVDAARVAKAGAGKATPGQQVELASPIRPALHFIPAGAFSMGSPPDEDGHYRDERQFEVTLPRPFVIMQTEVTQAQWAKLMRSNPSLEACADCPVGRVSWHEALAYANALSEAEGRRACYVLDGCNGKIGAGCSDAKRQGRYCKSDYHCEAKGRHPDCSGYRLPSEAEWEYAARAGSKAAWHGPRGDVAWTEENSGGRIQAVAQKAANRWGLHDMLGNVAEWTADWFGDYPTGRVVDPQGPASALGTRSYRGGDALDAATDARAATRDSSIPRMRSHQRGFRLVRRAE